jgi:hypothetical protein
MIVIVTRFLFLKKSNKRIHEKVANGEEKKLLLTLPYKRQKETNECTAPSCIRRETELA